jgi:hypothetical protein
MTDTAQDVGSSPIWERQPGETAKAWIAFRHYRDMGSTRSIRKVAALLGKTHQNFEKWSVQFTWTVRAAAFDEFRLDQDLQEKAEAYTYVRQIQLEDVAHMKSLALTRIMGAKKEDIEKMSLVEATKILERALRLENEFFGLDKFKYQPLLGPTDTD